MATREARLADFITDRLPDLGADVEVLCSDHVGTYAIPFPCRHDGFNWRNTASGEEIAAMVVGWRNWERVDPRR